MHLLNIPEEILIMVFDLLDLKSKLNLYNTCKSLRKLVCVQSLSKSFSLSRSILATYKTLQLNYFKNVSYNIEELDLSCVIDLTKTTLTKCLVHMKNLKTLNVSYTNITITDLITIKPKYNLKNITINFSFYKYKSLKISQSTLHASQELFKDIENVHFVGSIYNLIYSQLPMYVLARATALNNVQFTAMQTFPTVNYEKVNCNTMFSFHQFSIHFPDYIDSRFDYNQMLSYNSIFDFLDVNRLEFVMIMKPDFEKSKVLTTPRVDYVFQHLKIDTKFIRTFSNLQFTRNSAFLFWNKETVQLDNKFQMKLISRIKNYFPNYIQGNAYLFKNVYSKWFHMTPKKILISKTEDNHNVAAKRRRIGPPPEVLTLDPIFKDIEDVHLKLYSERLSSITVTILPNIHYLRKITVLSLGGLYAFKADFFSIVFKYCNNLITLNVESSPIHSCSSSLSASIHYSESLKNIRLVDKTIDYKLLFESFAKCSTLENVHLLQTLKQDCNFNVDDCVSFIEKSKNMYYLFIQIFISPAMKSRLSTLINKMKQKHKRGYLNVEVYNVYTEIGHTQIQTNNMCDVGSSTYYPYISDFNLSTMLL